MNHSTTLAMTMTAICLPLTAQAYCDRFPNSTLTLSLPATITVPDSLPNGSVITTKAFDGASPAFIANCPSVVRRWLVGRYPNDRFPGTLMYRTEVPGIGLRIQMTWADGASNPYFAIHTFPPAVTYGKIPSFTSATATFYKMAPVTTGTIPSGSIWEQRWINFSEVYRLNLGNSVRFVRPAATCDLATGDVNRAIALPAIKVDALSSALFAGVHNFELTANCSDTANVTFRFGGTPAPGNTALFANSGSARGIGLWLYSRINGVTQTISPNDTRMVTVSNNRAVVPLSAAYYKNGAVGAGTLASTATVNITYN